MEFPVEQKRLKLDLQQQQLLLVLDGFEQIVDAALLIPALLAAAPSLKVLVTSHTPLHISHEHQFPVLPLALPAASDALSVERVRESAAVRLFIKRAQAVDPGFQLTYENASAVVTICNHLDGVPLALELAAVWVSVLSCAEISQEIDQNLGFLRSPMQDVSEQHRSLRAAFDHSWQLLTAEEQRVFRQLAVFQGGFDRAAGEQVAGATLPLLRAMIEKSLLLPSTPRRYQMLKPVQQYADQQLQRAGEMQQTHQRHLEYFLQLVETAGSHLHSTIQSMWLERLEADYENLRAALAWALDEGLSEAALRLCSMLWWFWHIRGYLSEGRQWLAEVLANRSTAPTSVLAQALDGAGVLAFAQGGLRTRADDV